VALYPSTGLFPSASLYPAGVVPPTPHPPLTPLVDQGGQGLMVAVYDYAYTLQGYANDYLSCSATFQHMDTGTGTLVLPETHPVVAQVNKAGNQVVPVTVTDRFGHRWSGRVEQDSIDEGDGQSQAAPGSGTVTLTLVDEWPMLKRILASPFGASTALTYATGAPEFDTRTGPIETVVKGYITDACTRIWGSSSPVVVTPPPTSDLSPSVTLSAKWTPISDLVSEQLRAANRTLVIYLWLPGDPQPAGLSLSAPCYVVDIVPARNNPQIIWNDDTFLQRKIAVKAPTAYKAIIGGSGSGTSQVFDSWTDTGLQQSLGLYGYPEAYFSASSASTTVTTQQDAQTQLLATEGGVAVQATVQDGVPWSFGTDYAVGDLVGVRALGLDFRQRVVSVQMVDDRASGFRLVPTVGDDVATLTPQQRLFRTVRSLGMRVHQIQMGT
jgi:hypothetical protein